MSFCFTFTSFFPFILFRFFFSQSPSFTNWTSSCLFI
jgi:hypothetical protein